VFACDGSRDEPSCDAWAVMKRSAAQQTRTTPREIFFCSSFFDFPSLKPKEDLFSSVRQHSDELSHFFIFFFADDIIHVV
jgi:hypothetical protein